MLLKYLLKIKLRTILYIFVLFIFILYWVRSTPNKKSKTPVILWWTSLINDTSPRYINCEINKCIVTENREYLNKPETFVLLFYGSNFNVYDIPLPRNTEQNWAVIHEESPKNVPLFLGDDSWSIFNYTSTFSRFSDFPITLQHAPNVQTLLSDQYFISIKEKNLLLNKLAPILYIQSDCVTPLERDSYVLELMKYIPIDSYGTCLNNKQLPDILKIDPLNHLYSKEFLHFVGQYKFVISFENSICYDYITEKLWRPLIAGSVPIYLGSPTIKDWLPNNKSAILIDDFKTPKDLAKYLQQLNTNDDLYNSYLEHKITGVIKNQYLLDNLMKRNWVIDKNDHDESEMHFFEAFECYLCDRKEAKNLMNMEKIYECPDLISPITKRLNETNWWNDVWREGKCQARLLKKYITENKTDKITEEMFEMETERLINENLC